MSRNEERIDDLEKGYVRVETAVNTAAQAIRDQKVSLDKLGESIGTLSSAFAGTKATIKAITTVLIACAVAIIGGIYLEWSVYTKLGQLGERTEHLSEELSKVQTNAAKIETAVGAWGDKLPELRGDIAEVKNQKSIDLSAAAEMTTKIQQALADIEAARAASQEIAKAIHAPATIVYFVLDENFVTDTSEGITALVWESEYVDVMPGRKAEDAVLGYVSQPIPYERLPGSTLDARVVEGRRFKVRMSMNSIDDKTKMEEFFKKTKGTMSVEVAIYFAAK